MFVNRYKVENVRGYGFAVNIKYWFAPFLWLTITWSQTKARAELLAERHKSGCKIN